MGIKTEKSIRIKLLWTMVSCLALGIFCLAWAYHNHLSHQDFKQSARPALGEVVDVRPKNGDRVQRFLDFFVKCHRCWEYGGRAEFLRLRRPYYITVAFIDHLGNRQVFRPDYSLSLEHYQQLEARFGRNKVGVLYAPDNPQKAVIDESDIWHVETGKILLGGLLLTVSLGMLVGLLVRTRRQGNHGSGNVFASYSSQ